MASEMTGGVSLGWKFHSNYSDCARSLFFSDASLFVTSGFFRSTYLVPFSFLAAHIK